MRRDRACYHRAVTPSGRAARPLLLSALAFALVASHAAGQSPFSELLNDLASAVAKGVGPADRVQVIATSPVGRDFLQLLQQRGLQIVAAGADVVIASTCSETLRERLCLADLRGRDSSQLISVQRSRDDIVHSEISPSLVLDLVPLIAQRDPILDAVVVGDRLIVLDPFNVTRYGRTAQGWRREDSKPISASRPWPRDVRGKIALDRATVEAFLPGAVCRGTIDPLALTCGEEQHAWPIGADNQGIAPGRNYFSLPDGRTFFAFARLGDDAGARMLAATQQGQLMFLDSAGAPVGSAVKSSDDAVSVASACASASHVLLPEPAGETGEGDTLRLFRVAKRELTAVTPPVVLPGSLTALWPSPDTASATAVAHSASTGGYEAFQVRVSCAR